MSALFMPTKRNTVLLAMALLTGCASVAPPSQIPTSQQQLAVRTSTAALAAGVERGQLSTDWWLALADPQLDALLRQAMQYNHQRQAALATVRAARLAADVTRREALPQGNLSAQVQRQQLSSIEVDPYRQAQPRPPAQQLGILQQSLSWELDLFGRAGTAAAIAERQADIKEADLRAATLLLQADVVRQYTRWQQARLSRTLLQEELKARQERDAQLLHRQQAGLVDPRDVLAAASTTQQTQAEMATNEATATSAAAALAVLCGENPLSALHDSDDLRMPVVPVDTAILYPDDLLTRRPDVVRADAQLRVSLGEAVLADRAHLPRLSLNLSAGLMAPLGQLGNADALRYTLGPAFNWDWLDAGRRAVQRAGAEQNQLAAWHGYEQAVLTALQEGEISLRQWKASRSQLTSAETAATLANRSASYSLTRSRVGLEPQNLALAQHAAALQAQRSELAAHTTAIEAYVQVQLALGAWQEIPNREDIR